MVGMDVRLQNPFDAQTLGLNHFGDGIGGVGPYPSGGGIIIEHWIDDRGGLRRRIYHKVAKGFGHLFEERDNPRTHGLLRSTAWRDIYCFWIKYQFTSHETCQTRGMSIKVTRRPHRANVFASVAGYPG